MASGVLPARRVTGVCRLRPDHYEEHKKMHTKEHIWPEVLQAMYDANVRNYNLFYDKRFSLLFSYFEYIGPDFDADVKKLRENEDMQRWWKTYADKQVEPFDHDWSGPLPSATGKYFTPMEEMFHSGETATGYR